MPLLLIEISTIPESFEGLTALMWLSSTTEKLVAADVPHAPVLNYAQLFAEPQAAARGLRLTVRDPSGKPLDLMGSPFHIDGATMPQATMPPHLGQDTDEVLQKLLGLDEKRCAELRERGVI